MTDTAHEAPVASATCAGLCAFRGMTSSAQAAHASWKDFSVAQRLSALRRARHLMASQSAAFTAAISAELPRSKADTIVTELLPLLDACKFLERNAKRLLAPRMLGRSGRPLWLSGVRAEVHREALGHILVIGPANFPLFLPGVQVLQALAAGNTVSWKPGSGGVAVARLMADALQRAGLPADTLRVTEESVAAGQHALAAKPDKVIFTGSAESGGAILTQLAQSLTPAVVELSGADAVVILPRADLKVAAKAIAFGLRLNGGQVCMSPRRVFATASTVTALTPLLENELAQIPPVPIAEKTAARLGELIGEAQSMGAEVKEAVCPEEQRPVVVKDATPQMNVTRCDLFAPVVSLISLRSMLELPEAYGACPYGLTVAIFCGREEESQAKGFAKLLRAGTVLINDLIAPTADPRVPFGGRGASGYGTTRGAEGLLEMTAVKTVLIRRGGKMRHLQPASDADAPMLGGMVQAMHGGSWKQRWQGMQALIKSSREASQREQ